MSVAALHTRCRTQVYFHPLAHLRRSEMVVVVVVVDVKANDDAHG